MTKQEIIKWIKETKEDLKTRHIDEMDLPDLDLLETEKEKQAFKQGMLLVSESLLNCI